MNTKALLLSICIFVMGSQLVAADTNAKLIKILSKESENEQMNFGGKLIAASFCAVVGNIMILGGAGKALFADEPLFNWGVPLIGVGSCAMKKAFDYIKSAEDHLRESRQLENEASLLKD